MVECRNYTVKGKRLDGGRRDGRRGGGMGESTCVGEETFTADRVTAVCEVPGTGCRVLGNIDLCDIDVLVVREEAFRAVDEFMSLEGRFRHDQKCRSVGRSRSKPSIPIRKEYLKR